MELKTKIDAEEGRPDLVITREFDLPVELVFKAYTEKEFLEQWMNTKMVKLESKSHGCYRFETSDHKGNVVVKANGAIHSVDPNRKIVRTFEMENAPFGIQLEILDFVGLTAGTSRLTIHTIYESVEKRDLLMQLPFKQGINMAHSRLQDVMGKLENI